ncbi:hypothetical protein [Actinoplanes sp. NBRC 101535]|uniref:hypothetical protein n=1 Tax=Actinoplanes sp. NBRC 101535 TaxID=3032196 RepID=UPI0024A46FD0|nr:hypothetical protein [Actinoplanes sp. NBRC 101535]GLY05515.1 hypothetical protein Acsp01_58940 [Actinoplanes sp. NBRC 101535]
MSGESSASGPAGGTTPSGGDKSAAGATSSGPKDGTASKSTGKTDRHAKGAATAKQGRDDTGPLSGGGPNPLADQSEAYRSGLNYLSVGNSAFVDSSQIRDLQIGTRIVQNLVAGYQGALGPGPVRDTVMAGIRATYVSVDGYHDLLAVLRERHAIVLRSAPGTGRTTTALHLLDAVTTGKVARVAEDREVERLSAEDIEECWGYLAESDGVGLREMHMDRLGQLMREKNAYCVVIVDLDALRPDTLGGYVRDHIAPEIPPTIDAHIREALRDHDGLDVIDRLRGLAREPETLATLGPQPHVSEVVELASLLVTHGRGEIGYEDVLIRSRQMIERQVLAWFAPLRAANKGSAHETELRTGSLRIALAVFSDSPYDHVVNTAEDLAQRLISTTAITRNRRRPVFSDDRSGQLATMRCHMVEKPMFVNGLPVPSQRVLFDDDRFPMAILTCIWKWHHTVHPAVVDWLKELVKESRAFVWVRAAQALSVLCAMNFASVLHDLVQPWAASADEDERMASAIILDLAAYDERVRPAVRAVIHKWVRGDDNRLRWTAALAQSRNLGLRDPEIALDHLRIIGTWRKVRSYAVREEPEEETDEETVGSLELHLAARWSVASLFAAGAVEPVLDHLNAWLLERRNGLRTFALSCILQLMATRPFAGWEPDGHIIAADRARWPLLLTLLERNPALADNFADLVWQTLNAAPNDVFGANQLREWIREAERDPACLSALESFLPLLADSDHARDHLRYLVRSMRVDWVDPLAPAVADLIEQAIDKG